MVQLSDGLAMIALGVRGDAPPVTEQPPLADGVHLRWTFDRSLGFPWHGFFLYRRQSGTVERTCLASGFRAMVGETPSTTGFVGADEFRSDRPLVLTDDFPTPDRYELDLGPYNDFGRTFLQLAIHDGEVATWVRGEIGFRGRQGRLHCVDLTDLGHLDPRRPIVLDGFEIDVRGRRATTDDIDVAGGAVIRLTEPSDLVRLVFDQGGKDSIVVGTSPVDPGPPGLPGRAPARFAAEGLDEAGKRTATGVLSGDATVRLTATGRPIATVVLRADTDRPVLLTRICRGTADRTRRSVRVTADHRGVPVASATVTGRPGEVVPFEFRADAIDRVRLTDGDGAGAMPDAALVELCYQPLLLTGSLGWEPLDGCPQPITLPLTHPDYPASGARRQDAAAARAEADARLRYPAPPTFGDPEFTELHAALVSLVEGGPGVPMADPSRAPDLVGVPIDPTGAALPTMPAQHPLDLLLLTAIHPAMAQMLGLYRLDDTAVPGTSYDYLLLADTTGVSGGSAKKAFNAWRQNDPGVLAAIVSDEAAGPATPLPAPTDVRAYALPGGTIGAAHLAGSVGLRWHLPTAGDVLLPQSAVTYHLWRDRQGDATDPVPSGGLGDHLTAAGPALVAEPVLDPFHPVQWPPQWPPRAMYRVDPLTDEGWYAYRLSGMDLFGRFSPTSGPARWYQWAPTPSPTPWYHTDPPGETVVHPGAVRILDKIPPPVPAGVEATVLDPDDPYLVRDTAYDTWRAGQPADLVGLRVSWRWTAAQLAQAPDTAEFRVYWNPGGTPPSGPPAWQDRVHVTPIGDGVPSGDGLRFEVFLPTADGTVFATGVPLLPTTAVPLKYAHVGVSAADAVAHTADAARWASGAWGGRPGNEGRLGGPAKVYRVRREPPPAPVIPAGGERVFATPADYAARSFHTFRWTPGTNLTTHIHRALDESVFAADRRARPRPALSAADTALFPDPAVEPRWNATLRAQVATELNALNGSPDLPAAYRALSDDALRVLAGLTGTERAFTQLTSAALDPDDPATADRPGPDDPPDRPADPGLRIFVDTLDGRSRNRYLYRASHVDGAQNRGPLSLSCPPVWLPRVTPPRTPAVRSASGGESAVTLTWASNREPDLAAYRVYRTADEARARDPRAMELVHTVAVTAGDPRPGRVDWVDSPVPAQTTLWYRLAAVDTAGNVSPPTRPIPARAYRSVPPSAPDWTASGWNTTGDAVHLEWAHYEPGLRSLVQRRLDGATRWIAVSGWLDADTAAFDDPTADPTAGHFYRVLVRDATGNVSPTAPARLVPEAGP